MEKEIENSYFIDEYNKKLQSNNKRDIQMTYINKKEEKTIYDLSTSSAIMINTNNVNHIKKVESKKNSEISSIKNIKNDLNQTKSKKDIFEIIKNNNNVTDSSVVFLGKKIKNLFAQNNNNNNSNDKIPNDENDNNIVLNLKKVNFQDKNRYRKEQAIKTNNINNINNINNNNINICEKLEIINNNNNNKNIDIHKYNNKKNYKCYNIDEVELLHQTEEYKRNLYFNFNEEIRKMERKFISDYYS